MIKETKEKKSYKFIPNVAASLYVLSQIGIQEKVHVLLATKKLEELEQAEREKKQIEIKQVLRAQQYFQAQRQVIFYYLLENNLAKFSTYVVVKGIPYGLIELYGYKFYCVVSKKFIKKFDAEMIGESFIDFPIQSFEKLEEIMPLKDAKRIFKLYHAEVLRRNEVKKRQAVKKIEKPKQKPERKPHLDQQAKNNTEPKILGQSKLQSGNVIVVKKRTIAK